MNGTGTLEQCLDIIKVDIVFVGATISVVTIKMEAIKINWMTKQQKWAHTIFAKEVHLVIKKKIIVL